MFGREFTSVLRNFQAKMTPVFHRSSQRQQRNFTTQLNSHGSGVSPAAKIAGSALILGGGAVLAVSQPQPLESTSTPVDQLPPWVTEATSNHKEVLSTRQMLMNKLLDRFVEDDHLFEAMKQTGQIKDFRYFYDSQKGTFQTVVNLGKEVCGFPATVHGGLTAAIVDETLGGLALSVWREGRLGFRFPAYTARLELDYKKKIPAGSVILCSTQVERIEGRKMWMTAKVTDGCGATYATARALFVAPRVLPAWMNLNFGRGRGDAAKGKADANAVVPFSDASGSEKDDGSSRSSRSSGRAPAAN